MIYVGLDVHKGFSRMGCFDPAIGEKAMCGREERSEMSAGPSAFHAA